MYNHQLVYKVVIWAFFGISLWTEKVALKYGILSNRKNQCEINIFPLSGNKLFLYLYIKTKSLKYVSAYYEK